jgi:hypothetical protein
MSGARALFPLHLAAWLCARSLHVVTRLLLIFLCLSILTNGVSFLQTTTYI